jgi:hypothetical protein
MTPSIMRYTCVEVGIGLYSKGLDSMSLGTAASDSCLFVSGLSKGCQREQINISDSKMNARKLIGEGLEIQGPLQRKPIPSLILEQAFYKHAIPLLMLRPARDSGCCCHGVI